MASQKIQPLIGTGTFFVCAGELLHIIGLATTHWLEAKESNVHYGLFKVCGGQLTVCEDIQNKPDELNAVIAMTILGMLCGLVACASVLFFIVSQVMSKPPPVLMAFGGFVAAIAAFIFIVIGIIVFSVKIYYDDLRASSHIKFGYSFALCITGAILMPMGGSLVYYRGRSMVV